MPKEARCDIGLTQFELVVLQLIGQLLTKLQVLRVEVGRAKSAPEIEAA